MLDLIRSLSLLPGPSGHEEAVADFIRKFACERGWGVENDPLGNLIVFVGEEKPQNGIVFMAHMDEVCLFVKRIDENGFLRIEKTGGMTERDFYGQRVIVLGNNGPVFGVVGTKPNHLVTQVESRRVPPASEMYIDVGASSRDEVLSLGIYVGAPIVYARYFNVLNDRVFGTALDNRAGIAVVLNILGDIAKASLHEKICAIFSVQEELILRGGVTAVRALSPKLVIAVDAIVACDTPELGGCTEVQLGKGPVVNMYTFHGKGEAIGVIPDKKVVKQLVEVARQKGIRLQYNVMSGLVTDAAYSRIEGAGAAAIEIGFPLRYAHGATEVCDLKDLNDLNLLLSEYIISCHD